MASRRIQVEIIGDARSLKAALGASSAGLSTFEKRANRLGTSMTNTGRTMTRNVTLPVLGLAAAATKMALDYDAAMNHVQALTGASAKQTKEWGDQILRLGPRIGQSPQQLAEALYFVASSGAKVNQVMPITAASARLAAAGMGDAQVVAQLLTSAMNAYGSKALSAKKSSDILTEAIKVGKAEPAEFAQELGKVIPVAQNLGVSFAEVAGITASLTNTGLDAATATTGLRNVLLKMLAPTKQSAEELKKVGLSVADLQNEVKNKGVIATLQDLNSRVDGNRQAMHKLLPDARGLTAALALIGPNGDKAARAVDKVEHSTGAAAKAFKTAQAGPAQRFQRELAQIEATAVRVGNDLLPVALDVLTTVADLADKFDHLSDTEKHAIEIGLGVAALSGPLLTVGGNVVKLVGLFGKLGRVAGAGGAAGGAAEAETAIAGAGAAAGTSAAIFGGVFTVAVAGLALSLANVIKESQGNADAFGHVDDETKRFIKSTLAATGATSSLGQEIRSGGKNVAGYRDLIDRAGSAANRTADKIQNRLQWSTGQLSKTLRGTARQNILQYASNLRGVARDAEAASHDTEHFGKSTRDHYAHVAAMARATAALATAMNSVPNQKYVSLVVSVTENLRTEALAPGMGPEANRVGPGGSYHPTPVKGPASGTGQGGSGANRASGGVVMAGRSYIVGDTAYPETFTSDVPGRISRGGVGHAGGGRVAIVIENWETGTGYMQAIGQGSVARGARKRRQLDRMGSDG